MSTGTMLSRGITMASAAPVSVLSASTMMVSLWPSVASLVVSFVVRLSNPMNATVTMCSLSA